MSIVGVRPWGRLYCERLAKNGVVANCRKGELLKLILERTPHNSLVSVNGGCADDTAIRMACESAHQNKGKVYLLHVAEVERHLPIDAAPERDVVRGETVLDIFDGVCREEPCPVEAAIVQAREAGPTIVEEAIFRQAGLIIMARPSTATVASTASVAPSPMC